ncbi:MAG: DUF2905 domain-containing protein [Chloroflexi bacterium]|nr:MAG: DUF2905 domain-containing protein [Chloroflexota bacterium]
MPAVRIFLILGIVFIVISGILYLGVRFNLFERIPLGRLPGDVRIQTENFTCFFPLATSIILSIVLTILLNIIIRFLNR